MAGILPQCTARQAVQQSKTWVPTTYSLITPAHSHNSGVGIGLDHHKALFT